MAMYFALFEECLVVPEKNNPAIYNTFTGNVYVISDSEAVFLSNLEMGKSIEQAANVAALDSSRANHFVELYIENKLGATSQKPKNTAKNFPNYISMEAYWAKPRPRLNYATISLSRLCTKHCEHCNQLEITVSTPCSTCIGIEKEFINSFMPLDMADNILQQLKQLGCSTVVFRIPDFSVNPDYFETVLDIAARLKFDFIAILLGNDIVKPNQIKRLQEKGIISIIQLVINGENDCQIVEKIIKTLEDEKLTHCFHILSDVGFAEKNSERLSQISTQFPNRKISFDSIVDRKTAKEMLDNPKLNRVLSIPSMTPSRMAHNYSNNECLYGKIYINQDGDAFPCPAMTDFYLGNALDLRKLFSSERITKFWLLPKKMLKPCNECGLKYACNDCRGLDYQISGDLYSTQFCPQHIL